MYSKKNTMQTAQKFVESITDDNLKSRYGTSLTEYMTNEQSKKIEEKIIELRKEFNQIGKSKTSSITFNELIEFFNEKNVKYYLYNIIYIYIIFIAK